MSESAASQRELRLAEALAEFVDLQAEGKLIEILQFCELHPDLQPELAEQLRTMSEIDGDQEVAPGGLPQRLSGHKVLDTLGSGGMGRVFLAMDEGLGRRVAIKTLADRYLRDGSLRERFMHEARAMARLSHPHIARIYNLGKPDEIPHFVMEYIDGVPLTQAARALTLDQKVEMMHKVVAAVDFLHGHKILHRDLKPGNILVGHDLEPKLLDFGLALNVDDGTRLSWPGMVVGTPRYFSPEQARAEASLDARSDVFSLGTIFYELLTGVPPFQAGTIQGEIQAICESDPVLPKRIDSQIPGELQNICLKALEKAPADRYRSAGEMAEDLARYLAGEKPLAAPTSYARMMSGKIDRHLRELDAWQQDEILSDDEHRLLRKGYGRLIEREDAWIMEVRRLTVSQVSLYFGAWLSVVGAALLVLFYYRNLWGILKVAVAAAAVLPMGGIGVRCWNRGLLRIGIAYLLAFCLLLPLALLVTMSEYNIRATVVEGSENLELIQGQGREDPDPAQVLQPITNDQLQWALLLSLPAYFWLRRFTRSSVFSLVFAIATALLCGVKLLQAGLLQWTAEKFFPHLIPIALLFFALGLIIELCGYAGDSRYFYPIAVVLTWAALTGLAFTHNGYLRFVNSLSPRIRDQREYLFLVNAAIYFCLQAICQRVPLTQMRTAGRAFRWVIPGHLLTSLTSLGINAMEKWNKHAPQPNLAFRTEARFFEVLIPCVAIFFIFRSISLQMKNYFVWGMVFVAFGIIQLQQDIFEGHRSWLISLILGGLAIMFTSIHYADIRIRVTRRLRRTS